MLDCNDFQDFLCEKPDQDKNIAAVLLGDKARMMGNGND